MDHDSPNRNTSVKDALWRLPARLFQMSVHDLAAVICPTSGIRFLPFLPSFLALEKNQPTLRQRQAKINLLQGMLTLCISVSMIRGADPSLHKVGTGITGI